MDRLSPDRPNRRWLTIREAAQYLSLSEHGCRKLADRGEIPAVRIGRAVRVDILGLDGELENQLKAVRGSVKKAPSAMKLKRLAEDPGARLAPRDSVLRRSSHRGQSEKGQT